MGNNDLTPKDILAIFKENGLFSVEETPIGECIKMPALDAFIFGDITGSAYIDNPVFPYTTKGLLKIYYNTMDYNRVSGVFVTRQEYFPTKGLFFLIQSINILSLYLSILSLSYRIN